MPCHKTWHIAAPHVTHPFQPPLKHLPHNPAPNTVGIRCESSPTGTRGTRGRHSGSYSTRISGLLREGFLDHFTCDFGVPTSHQLVLHSSSQSLQRSVHES